MKILVIGGAGFQGSHLSEKLLDNGHQVTILNTLSLYAEFNIEDIIDKVNIVWGSITDKELVYKTVRDHDVVFDLASRMNVDESRHLPRDYVNVNVNGTLNVLEAVRKIGCKLIYISTCEVYGHKENRYTVYEDSEFLPYSPYAASKAAADRLCFAYHKTYGVDVTIVRPANVYGPRQRFGIGGNVIPIFVNLADQDKPLPIFGDGEQRREFINVSDLVNAYMLLLKKDLAGEAINIGSGFTISINQIANYIARKFKVPVRHEEPRPGEVPGFLLDCRKMIIIWMAIRDPFLGWCRAVHSMVSRELWYS